MTISAIIFDLDGVLVPTGIIHRRSLEDAIFSVTSTKVDISDQSMFSTKEKLKKVQNTMVFSDANYYEILTLKDSFFRYQIQSLVAAENTINCLQQIRSYSIPVAVASNSRLENILQILEITNLKKYIDVVVSGQEVASPKPAPDILFEVYRRLGLPKAEYSSTVFVEDTDEGAAAGYSSPSHVVKINNPSDLTFELFKEWL